MYNPLISVIVAIYNSDIYLKRCLDSILEQTYQNFELLLINDGSTDTSATICDDYSKIDSRIRVFYQENKGVSSARQKGIDEALGIYSIHVDSDDWIDKYMLEKMILNIKNADILVVDYFKEKDSKVSIIEQNIKGQTSEEIIDRIFQRKIHGSLCNKLVLHKLYKEFAISFPLEINYCEDQLTIIRLISVSTKIEYFSEAFYYYCDNNNSITNAVNRAFFEKVDNYVKYLESNQIKFKKITKKMLLNNKIMIKVDMMYSKQFLDSEIKNKYVEANTYLFQSTTTFFSKIRLFLMFIGLGFIARKTY